MSSLVTLALLPLLGAVLVAVLPSSNELRIKQAAVGTTLLTALFGILLATQFVASDTALQFVQKNEWIPSFAINFSVGVDGLSLVLILMSVVLTPIVVLAGWHESEGGRWSARSSTFLFSFSRP